MYLFRHQFLQHILVIGGLLLSQWALAEGSRGSQQDLMNLVNDLVQQPTQSQSAEPHASTGSQPLFSDTVSQTTKQWDSKINHIQNSPETVRARVVSLNQGSSLNKSFQGSSAVLNLFPGVEVPLRQPQMKRFDDRLQGIVQDSAESTVVVISDGAQLDASIHHQGRYYQVHSLGNSQHLIVEKDLRKLPPEHPPSGERKQFDFNSLFDRSLAGPPEIDTSHPEAPVVIRTLVVYTPDAENEAANIKRTIKLALKESNVGYEQSGVRMRLRPTQITRINYQESGDMEVDLSRLTEKADNYMDEIHALRDQTKSDIVVLVTRKSNYCGIASDIYADESRAFAVVGHNCATGYYSFAHEIGHLMGARHDHHVDPSTKPFPFAHGAISPDQQWRTIMAYGNACQNCKRINRWSSPDVKWQNSPTGQSLQADNARALNIAASIMSAYR